MIEEALTYPTSDDRGLARIGIGGLLVILGVFVLPAFVVYGYLLRVLERTSRGVEEPPVFEDWTALFVDGLKAAVVSFAYAVVPWLLLTVVLGLVGAGLGGRGGGSGLVAGLGVLGFLVFLPFAFLVQYVLPAALTNMAREDRIGAAFDFDALRPVLTSSDYVLAVVVVFLVAMAGAVLFSIVGALTFGLGLLLGPFFYFWLYVVGSSLLGSAFGTVVGDGSSPA